MPAPLDERHFRHINVAARIDAHGVRPKELVRALAEVRVAEAVEHVALPVVDADAVADVGYTALHRRGALFPDKHGRVSPFADDFDAARFMSGPLAYKLAVGGEDLHTVALTVAHDHQIVVKHGDVVRQIELPVVGSGFAPRHDVVAVGVHPVDA